MVEKKGPHIFQNHLGERKKEKKRIWGRTRWGANVQIYEEGQNLGSSKRRRGFMTWPWPTHFKEQPKGGAGGRQKILKTTRVNGNYK